MTEPTSHPRVLVIDDDPLVRLMVGEALSQAHYAITTAASAEEGLHEFARQAHDLVLLDVLLPGMDGFATCRQIRQSDTGALLPIVMLTGLDDRGSIKAATDAGATDFITKPIAWELLPYRIEQVLRAARNLRDLYDSRALLARAQRIAQLGTWEWLPGVPGVKRSEEIYRIFRSSPETLPATLTGTLPLIAEEDQERVRAFFDEATRSVQDRSIDYCIHWDDGDVRNIHEHTEVECDADGAIVRVQGIVQDVSDRVEAAERIRILAYYDTLTGLSNREFFRETLQQSIRQSRRDGSGCALLFVDIDRFKRVNETLGPRAGDGVLQTVAQRLLECLRAADLKGVARGIDADGAARLGSDEFTLFLVNMDSPIAGATRVARRILDAIAEPIVCAGQELKLTASVGIALFPQDSDTADGLIRDAETAMHTAKLSGYSGISFYDESMSRIAQDKLDTENALRNAPDKGELRLFYQPKVSGKTGEMRGTEALIRWQHPTRGLVPPLEFIPIAEESGVIIPITRWVIRQACRQQRLWMDIGLDIVPVSINLSCAAFRDADLLAVLSAALREFNLSPAMLECEVTETLLMEDVDRAIEVLGAIKTMGVKISIDDFGTGYSSLAYLKRLPIDVLKIDRSFVKDVADNPSDAAIASAIIAMARVLNLETVAEGVETGFQARLLLERGCDLMQGFLFAKPVPPDDFAGFLAGSPFGNHD